MATQTSPKIKTMFTNTKGEKVTVYTDGTKKRIPAVSSPTVVNDQGAVDVSKIPEGVEVVDIPGTNLQDLSVAFSGKADETTMNDIATRDPRLASLAKQYQDTGTFVSPTPTDPTTELTGADKVASEAAAVASEIRTLEEKMANREQTKSDAYDSAGIFEDLRQFNKLKEKQRAIQDREIEIPIEAKQQLRGRMATKDDFNQLTAPAIESNLMDQLAISRQVSAYSDAIETNLAVIDSKLKAANDRDDFIYSEKIKQLNTLQTAYSNIITEEQKQAIEFQKFQYDLLRDASKADNDLRNDLLKEFATSGKFSGMQLNDMLDMPIDQLLTMSYDEKTPTNWANLSYEEAATTLDKESFDRYQKYIEWKKTATEEEDTAVTQKLAIQQTAENTIGLIESLLNDKSGLETSVGTSWAGRSDFREGLVTGFGSESKTFRANAKKLLSQATLDKLLELKAAGGTLGAISEKELDILANAATALGTLTDKEGRATGRFDMSEEDFKTALETMRLASMKVYIAETIGKKAYGAAGYQNMGVEDFDTIEKRYKDLKANPPGSTNYAEQELRSNQNLDSAFNLIKQEEGLRTEAYQDTTGTWTIGFGNTQINGRPVQPGDRLTERQAEALMQQSVIEKYTSFANNIQTEVTPNQFAALTSFEYNLGSDVWNTPTGREILSLINQGRNEEAGRLMLQYHKAKDPRTGELVYNNVLAQRRMREANLLLS